MIDNGAFYRNAYTSFEVTLPDSIKTIGSSAFIMEYSCSLKVSIKKGLAYIDNYAFTCLYGIATINFEGTKEEWNAISKAEYWYAPYLGLGDQTIRVNCTDGALTFEYKMQ